MTRDALPEDLIAVYAVVRRTMTAEVERIPLNVEAFREGRIEPEITVENGGTFSFEEYYA